METTKRQRTIAAAIALLVGLYLMLVAPGQAMYTLKVALREVMERLIPFDPDFYPAVPILGATFGIWIILISLGGTLLLIVTYKIYKGSLEARATGLGVSAIAAVAGMTMFIPWMVLVVSDYSNGPVPGVLPPPADVSKTPPVMMIMFIGLLAYYVFLLSDTDKIKNKIYKFIIYTAIGVVAGMVFMNGQHGVRYFIFIPETTTDVVSIQRHRDTLGNAYTNLDYYDAIALTTISEEQLESIEPGKELDIVRKDKSVDKVVVKKAKPEINPNTLALFLGGYGNYLASYLMIFLIPFVFLRKRWAYDLLLAVTLYSGIVTFWNYFVRHSFEWFIGGLMSFGLLVLLLLPVFKKFLVETNDETTVEQQA